MRLTPHVGLWPFPGCSGDPEMQPLVDLFQADMLSMRVLGSYGARKDGLVVARTGSERAWPSCLMPP